MEETSNRKHEHVQTEKGNPRIQRMLLCFERFLWPEVSANRPRRLAEKLHLEA